MCAFDGTALKLFQGDLQFSATSSSSLVGNSPRSVFQMPQNLPCEGCHVLLSRRKTQIRFLAMSFSLCEDQKPGAMVNIKIAVVRTCSSPQKYGNFLHLTYPQIEISHVFPINTAMYVRMVNSFHLPKTSRPRASLGKGSRVEPSRDMVILEQLGSVTQMGCNSPPHGPGCTPAPPRYAKVAQVIKSSSQSILRDHHFLQQKNAMLALKNPNLSIDQRFLH